MTVGVYDRIVDSLNHTQRDLMRFDIRQRDKGTEPLYCLPDERDVMQIAGNNELNPPFVQLTSSLLDVQSCNGLLLIIKDLKYPIHPCEPEHRQDSVL